MIIKRVSVKEKEQELKSVESIMKLKTSSFILERLRSGLCAPALQQRKKAEKGCIRFFFFYLFSVSSRC